MIHYHGTPIGGRSVDAVEILRGRNALVSFAHPDQLPIVLDVCQSFVLDNGAFSQWRKDGEQVDFDAYSEWVEQYAYHPGFNWCLIPDIIDGIEADNIELVNKWCDENKKIKGVPVYHFNESLEWLEYLVNKFEWVALGSSGEFSSVGTKKWWARMGEIMAIACDDMGRPKAKLHGLRMLDPEIFSHIPLSAADSTNAARNNNQINRYGIYPPPTAGQRAAVIASRIEAHNSAPVWNGFKQADIFA